MARDVIVLAQANILEQATGTTASPGHAAVNAEFPPFDSQYWAPQIIWLVIVFGALYLFMSRVALPRVGTILERRQATISGDIDRAMALRGQADEAAKAYEKTLADARASAQQTGQAAHDRVNADSDARRHALEADLAQRLGAAEAQIATTKAKAMASVGQIAEEAATAIVQRLTGRSTDPQTIASAVAQAKQG